MRPTIVIVTVALGLLVAETAHAYAECGNPPGPSENVTTVKVSCADGRAFARKVAQRGVTTASG
jgi:hypothetical protein